MDKNLVNFRLEGGEEQDCAGPGRRTLVIASLTLFQFCAQPNFLAGLQELGTAKGTSAKDFQVEFLSFNFSYLDGLLAFAGSSLAASVNKQPLSDDLDSSFGLHDFEVSESGAAQLRGQGWAVLRAGEFGPRLARLRPHSLLRSARELRVAGAH